jgi:predicted XRE-type DNA-binding protein
LNNQTCRCPVSTCFAALVTGKTGHRLLEFIMPQFKILPGFPGYEMSSDGRAWKRKGEVLIELKPIVNRLRKGYLQISPYLNGKNKTLAIHRAMMLTFVGERPEGMEIAHLDGNKANNSIDNLAYVTCVENNSHKEAHGTYLSGEQCRTAKLTWHQVQEIRELYATGRYSQSQLANMFGVTQTPVSLIVRRKTWTNELSRQA